MKFKVTPYHHNLLKDFDRISLFNEAISNLNINHDLDEKVAFDLGCGSGILSYLAKDYFDKIISIDINHKIIKYTKENLEEFENIEVYCSDVIGFEFNNKADLIICEMLDTALIDEEEIPVLNYAKSFLKEDGQIIPQGIINSVEAIYMEHDYIQYDDKEGGANPIYQVLSDSVIYSEFDFLDDIDEDFSCEIEFKLLDNIDNITNLKNSDNLDKFYNKKNQNILVNGIKITSFTKFNDKLIGGPTPMLNPPMLIPIDAIKLKLGDNFKIKLSYVMGSGVETIHTEII